MNEKLRWLGPEPEGRTKPTKKEIKKGGMGIRGNRKRHGKDWEKELKEVREEK